jgi:hypothetical protein
MKRPQLVRQDESDVGQFWYTVRGGNGSNLLTSEMYPTRSNAIRAARAYIGSIDPVPVSFTFWVGAVPPRGDFGDAKTVTERVRW